MLPSTTTMISSTTAGLDDASIRTTLLNLKDLFFDSLCKGTRLLCEFDHSWSQFCGIVDTCTDNLSDDTRSMILSFAETLTAIIPGLLEVESTGDRIRQQLQEDISQITGERFSKLAIMDPQLEGSSYIKSAHAWLLDNLHNPYPPLEIRARIARKHRCLRKNVDAWFVDARRRIGWNAIRKTYFPRKADLITAARHFFKGRVTGSFPLSSSDKHDLEHCDLLFVDMMIRAKSLCLSNSTQLSDQDEQASLSKQQYEVHAAAFSYPSPEHSADGSPEPPSPLFPKTSLLGVDQQIETSARPDWNKSPSFLNRTILDNLDDQSPQREKFSVTSNRHQRQLGIQTDCERQPILQLPSPASSVNHSPAQAAPLTLSDATATTLLHPSKRKRRLSDTGPENIAKRHCQQYPLPVVGPDPIVHPSNEVTQVGVTAYDFCSQIPEPVRNIDFSSELFSIECMSYMLSPEDGELEFPCSTAFVGPNIQPFGSTTDFSRGFDLGLIPFANQLSGDHAGHLSKKDVDPYWNLGFDLDLAVATPEDAPVLLDWTNFTQGLQLSEFHQSPTVPVFNRSQAVVTSSCRQVAKFEHLREELPRSGIS